MTLRTSMVKTQKPLGGLLIVFSMIVLGGAGCATVQDVESNVATATTMAQEKVSAIQAAIESAQATYEKAKAIYEILNPDLPTPNTLHPTPDSTTPSVPPSEDLPQPAAEENTSSQLPPQVPDASTDQSL
jgi:hypothetical protein